LPMPALAADDEHGTLASAHVGQQPVEQVPLARPAQEPGGAGRGHPRTSVEERRSLREARPARSALGRGGLPLRQRVLKLSARTDAELGEDLFRCHSTVRGLR
jgi:hypothetical protein